MRWLNVTYFSIHMMLWFAKTTLGSGLENYRVVPEMKGIRMQPGGNPVGHRGRDPGQGWNTELATISHIKVMPSPPKYTFVWYICEHLGVIRDSIVSLFELSGAKSEELCYRDFLPFTTEYFSLCWPGLESLFIAKVLIMTEQIILIHLGPTKLLLQPLLALANPRELKQPGNRNEVLKWGWTTRPSSLYTQSLSPFLSSCTYHLPKSQKCLPPLTPMRKPAEGVGWEQCCSLSLLIMSWLSDLLWLALSGKVCIIWQKNSKILIYCKSRLCQWLLSGLPISPHVSALHFRKCTHLWKWIKQIKKQLFLFTGIKMDKCRHGTSSYATPQKKITSNRRVAWLSRGNKPREHSMTQVKLVL